MYDLHYHRHARKNVSQSQSQSLVSQHNSPLLPKRVRVAPSIISDSSCKSLSSTPTAAAYCGLLSPYSLVANSSLIEKDGGGSGGATPAPANRSADAGGGGFGGEIKDDDSMPALLERFSSLETEIKSLLNGKNSLKDRIQSLGSKQESMKSAIQRMEGQQLESIKCKLDVMERQAQSRVDYLTRLRQERIQSMEQARNSECLELPELPVVAPVADHIPLKRILSCWDENNCDLHLRRLIHSSRQIAAYEILEFAHKRLSTHLINHVSETARGLVGDEKSGYLAHFLKHGPFESKPVGEGTYGEVLKFVQREAKPRKELLKALKAAEDSLVQEAVNTGYRAIDVGDIRSQMTGFFTTAIENFDRYSYPIPLADTEVTIDVIEDTRLAAEQGKLGVLQKTSKLIKLGCYFLQWQLAAQGC